MLSNILLLFTITGGFEFDKKSGTIVKISAERVKELLYLVIAIGGLHIKFYRQQKFRRERKASKQLLV